MARDLNRVTLIGNLAHDPKLRYTDAGTPVCSFALATNRAWTEKNGEKHEDTEFHQVVAWHKIAELCSEHLQKGKKVYIEGRLASRKWTNKEGIEMTKTEIVIDDMIMLN